MNIVIPIVGLGKRFIDAGYEVPKPLILINNKPIIQYAIESLDIDGNYIFVIRKNIFSGDLKNLLHKLKPSCNIIEIDYLTEGSTNSILLAENFINNNNELLTTNCDQITNWNSKEFINFCKNKKIDGCVGTYKFEDIELNKKSPYSFILTDENKKAIKLEEKFAISSNALCGIHYWKKGKDFVYSAKEMIKNNDRVNNEFYVSKTYNYLIKYDKIITYYELKDNTFTSLGTPEDVQKYILWLKNENF